MPLSSNGRPHKSFQVKNSFALPVNRRRFGEPTRTAHRPCGSVQVGGVGTLPCSLSAFWFLTFRWGFRLPNGCNYFRNEGRDDLDYMSPSPYCEFEHSYCDEDPRWRRRHRGHTPPFQTQHSWKNSQVTHCIPGEGMKSWRCTPST